MLSFLYGKEKLATPVAKIEILRSFVGGTLSILFLCLLGQWTGYVYLMAPFGATCVILYAVAQSPLAQPRNVIFGHVLSAFIGLLLLKLFGVSIFSIALSVGSAIAFMQLCRCVHPPAGANPLVILLTAQHVQYDWSFLLFPVLFGAVGLILIASVVNNIGATQRWPSYGLALLSRKK